jgi:transposase
MHPISNSTIQNALVLLRQGKSAHQVATSLSIGYGTVCKYRNQYKDNIPEPKTGRPSKVTKTTKRLLA